MKIRLRILKDFDYWNCQGLVWRAPMKGDSPAVLEYLEETPQEDGSTLGEWKPIEVVEE